MNQTGFPGSCGWGACYTIGAEWEMRKDNLKRLLNQPGLQILTSPLYTRYSWRMLPVIQGNRERKAVGELGKLLVTASPEKGGIPSPSPPRDLKSPFIGGMHSRLIPPALHPMRMMAWVLYSKPTMGTWGCGCCCPRGFGSTHKGSQGRWGAAQCHPHQTQTVLEICSHPP